MTEVNHVPIKIFKSDELIFDDEETKVVLKFFF